MNKEDASMLNKVIAMGYIVENPEYKTFRGYSGRKKLYCTKEAEPGWKSKTA